MALNAERRCGGKKPSAQKSVAPAPATPQNLSATLDASTGALVLRWKCAQPVGTRGAAYLVRRRFYGESDFSFLGVSGRKTFEDAELPAGIEEVEYTVQAVRGKREGAVSAILTVRMGAKNSPPTEASAPASGIVPTGKALDVAQKLAR